MITSVSNSRVKRVVALNTKARERRLEGRYVVEGIKLFQEAPEEEMDEIYISEHFLQMASASACAGKLERLGYETVSEEVFRKMSDTSSPQGVLCVMRRKEYRLEDMLAGENPFLLILEELQDPGNLGTILRTAEGAGVDGVILSRESADIYNPKTIRSTMGSIYRVPFYYADSLEEASKVLKGAGIRLYAAYLQGSIWYDEADYRAGSAFLIGNEGNGLRPETAALADQRIRIPMKGKVESLNAAMAAGILMYEAAGQRRRGAEGSKNGI